MNKRAFEHRVLDLWMTTRIPMTRAALQYHSGAARKKLGRWLDELVLDGVLEVDSDDAGEFLYTVPGAARPPSGPKTFAEARTLASLTSSAGGGGRARGAAATRTGRADSAGGSKELALARLRRSATSESALLAVSTARRELEGKRAPGDKSALLSTGLSFFLGPLGWLYAGAWREAVPASAAYLVAMALLPTFLILPLLPFGMALSGVAGLVYALQYNRAGERKPILGPSRDDE